MWAAGQGRVVLTHDVQTMVGYAYDRVRAGRPMPGVVALPEDAPAGPAVEDLLLVVGASFEGELEDRVIFLPL